MSDIDSDEEPEDIADQLVPEWREQERRAATAAAEREEEEREREREAEEYERAMEREPPEYEPPTEVERDLSGANLGNEYGYVVYYSKAAH